MIRSGGQDGIYAGYAGRDTMLREEARWGLIHQFQKQRQMACTSAVLLETLTLFFARVLSSPAYKQLLTCKNFAFCSLTLSTSYHHSASPNPTLLGVWEGYLAQAHPRKQ